ncbi:MAG: insulinase family protein [Akkermansiaceae bacterium]|nr:insulinase family protein [Armatimonadota bacterium]
MKRNVAVVTALFAAGITLAVLETEPVFGADSVPPLAAAKPVQLPPVVERTLPNGLRVVLLEDHLQPSLSVRLAIPAGATRDPQDKVGLADATAALLDQGTTARTEDKIADTIDGLGASLDASADSDYTFVSASGLANYADTLFDLMADITLRPTFPADEWERHRTRTLSGITADLANPSSVASSVLARRVFGAHPYGNYESGTPETLARITPADLKTFHDTYFVPNGAVLFLVGDITPAKAEELAKKYFGEWQKKDAPSAPAAPTSSAQAKNRVTILDRPGSEQTEIRIGSLVGSYADPDRTVVNVANAVLGGGGFEGRLIKEIRVKRGLTYGANSSFSRQKDAGIFTISTFTKPATVGEAVQIALDETMKLAKEGPTATELGERKTYLTGSFAVGVATAQGVLGRVVPAILYGRGASEIGEYVGKVEAVTPDSARDALKRAVPETGLEIVLVGDAKAIQEQVSKFGDVTVIAFEDLDLNAPNLLRAKTDTTAPFGESDEARTAGAKLLADTITAHGGDAFVNIKTLKISGTGEFSTPPQAGGLTIPLDSFTLTTATGSRSRLAANSGLGDLLFVVRGENKGGFAVFAGQTQELSADQVSNIEPTEFLRVAVLKKYPVAAVKDDSTEKTTDGKSLLAYEVRSEKGDVTRVFVESDTKRVRKLVTKRPRGTAATVFLDGYATPIKSILLPGNLRVQQNGTDVFKLTFTKIEIDTPAADALFEKP